MMPGELFGLWAVRLGAAVGGGTLLVAAAGLWVRLFRACAGV